MVETELLNRIEKKDDRRFLALSLTDKGEKAAEKINLICDEYYTKLFEYIPEKKHASVIESLSLLSDAMSKMRKENSELRKGCCN